MTWLALFRRRPAAVQTREFVFHVDLDRELDGRWIADVEAIPGALAYGATVDEAVKRVSAVVLRTLADRLEHEELTAHVAPLNVQLIPRECVAQ
jgi:predicted RNase H-like HicB family nuclease